MAARSRLNPLGFYRAMCQSLPMPRATRRWPGISESLALTRSPLRSPPIPARLPAFPLLRWRRSFSSSTAPAGGLSSRIRSAWAKRSPQFGVPRPPTFSLLANAVALVALSCCDTTAPALARRRSAVVVHSQNSRASGEIQRPMFLPSITEA